MKLVSVSAILLAMLLTACGEKEAEAPAEPAPAPEVAAPAPAPAPVVHEAGGYVPTAEEQVKGITMTQEELDKMYAEARANTPLPTIPGEEPAAAAPAAQAAPDAEAVPAEAKK